MSTRTLGRNNEKKARDILIKDGFDVQMSPMPTRWARQTDLWGLWDLVGVRHDSIRFVQVKTNRRVHGKNLIPFKDWVCPENCSKEIWVFFKGIKQPEIRIIESAPGKPQDRSK